MTISEMQCNQNKCYFCHFTEVFEEGLLIMAYLKRGCPWLGLLCHWSVALHSRLVVFILLIYWCCRYEEVMVGIKEV